MTADLTLTNIEIIKNYTVFLLLKSWLFERISLEIWTIQKHEIYKGKVEMKKRFIW